MIYDCFLSLNELDLLEIRLNELDEVVDIFVIVEFNRTFSNIPKSYYYDDNKNRFKKFHKKIRHFRLDPSHRMGTDFWTNQYYQREQMGRGLIDCRENDWVIFSDIDEIPNLKSIDKVINSTSNVETGIFVLENLDFLYYINTVLYYDKTPRIWYGSRMIQYKNIVKYNYTQVDIKGLGSANVGAPQDPDSNRVIKIKDGGNHFCNLGSDKDRVFKWNALSKAEYQINRRGELSDDEFEKRISDSVNKLEPYLMQGDITEEFNIVELDHDSILLPDYVRINYDKFEHLFRKKDHVK